MSAPKISMPKPGSVADTVGRAAGEVAQRSQQLGAVASDVQKASNAIANGKDK